MLVALDWIWKVLCPFWISSGMSMCFKRVHFGKEDSLPWRRKFAVGCHTHCDIGTYPSSMWSRLLRDRVFSVHFSRFIRCFTEDWRSSYAVILFDIKKSRVIFPSSDQSLIMQPYYGGPSGFDTVLDLLEDACEGLLGKLGWTDVLQNWTPSLRCFRDLKCANIIGTIRRLHFVENNISIEVIWCLKLDH